MKDVFFKYWNAVIEVGTSDQNKAELNKRIRLVNMVALIAIISYFLFAFTYLFDGIGVTSIEAFIAALIIMLVIYLNSLGLYNFAKYFLSVLLGLMLTYLSMVHGAEDGAEYWLFPICVIGLMYIDQKLPLALLFLLNIVCFGILKYVHTITGPLVFDGNQLYDLNLFQSFIVLFLIAYSFKRENLQHEDLLQLQKEDLENEKGRSESLLNNILPNEVADELKKTGTTVPQYFEMATVIFTDFKDFTRASQIMSPADLIEQVNQYFSAFDEIIQRYNIEKIKTIGDAYMCVGGVPTPNISNPEDAALAALEMQEYVDSRKEECLLTNKFFFEMRVGIHTGPLIAGVIGKSKIAYDIWGDTVNTAARMETSCEIGKINISQFTYEHIKEKFKVSPRGRIEAKHKGLMEMYYVESKNQII